MTSHDVVAIARRALGTRKVGHAGTLDPMATGILVLGFNNGTRLLQYITDGDKTYQATMVLGAATITDDTEGEIISRTDTSAITDAQIEVELAKMRGAIMQRPSSVSAVKVDGERAYDRVRAGEVVELAARAVTIKQLDILVFAISFRALRSILRLLVRPVLLSVQLHAIVAAHWEWVDISQPFAAVESQALV